MGLFGGSKISTKGLERAARQAEQLQSQQLERARGEYMPFYTLGAGGAGRLGEYLGVSGDPTAEGYGQLVQPFGMEQFEADPGYQFRQAEAQKRLERGMAAQGMTLGGGATGGINPQVARALQEQSQNLASQEYGAAFDRYRAGQGDIYSRLYGVAGGIGMPTAGAMAGLGGEYATNIGNIRTNLAQAQLQAQMANRARRGGIMGTLGTLGGAAVGGMFGGLPGAQMGASLGGSLGGMF